MRAARMLLLALALAACDSGGSAEPDPAPSAIGACRARGILSLGDTLPDCSFRSFDGSVLTLASLRGKPAVLNFWASWCPPCRKEMPDFDAVAGELAGKVAVIGFDLLGVQGEREKDARAFANERSVDYPLVFDPDGRFYAHFSVAPRMPTTVLVDAAGTVVARRFGPLDRRELLALIDEHLR